MCEFFSAIVFKSGDVRFCEYDSHESLIQRLQLDDTRSLFGRPWVRVECQGDEHDDVRVDEDYTPSWVDADRDEFNERVLRTRARLLPLFEQMQRDRRAVEERFNKAYHELETRYDRVYELHSQLAAWPDDGIPGNEHDAIINVAKQLNRLETQAWQRAYDVAKVEPWNAYVASMQSFFGYIPERTDPVTVDEELGAEAEDDDSRDAGIQSQDDEV